MYAESGVFKPFYKQMASYEYHMTIEQTDPPPPLNQNQKTAIIIFLFQILNEVISLIRQIGTILKKSFKNFEVRGIRYNESITQILLGLWSTNFVNQCSLHLLAGHSSLLSFLSDFDIFWYVEAQNIKIAMVNR